LAHDDEVDDFGESPHNRPTQDGAQANAIMEAILNYKASSRLFENYFVFVSYELWSFLLLIYV
jgi:hypothetical protein